MKFSFYLGDRAVPLTRDELSRPFLLARGTAHPFLTLEAFFSSLAGSLLKNTTCAAAEQLTIRLVKHGACAHISRCTLVRDKHVLRKICAATAIGDERVAALQHEWVLRQDLERLDRHHFLAHVSSFDLHPVRDEKIATLFSDWQEEFHEWHVEETNGHEKILLWQPAAAQHILGHPLCDTVIAQAGMILSFFFDTVSFAHIENWHHAAGDFVVRDKEGKITTRLITVRSHRALEPAAGSLLEALLVFLLQTTLLLRCDRIAGTGRASVLGPWSVTAACRGIMDGLALQIRNGRLAPEAYEQFVSLLWTFTSRDFLQIYQVILPVCGADPEMQKIIADELDSHAALLASACSSEGNCYHNGANVMSPLRT